jgi:hypothetical protein
MPPSRRIAVGAGIVSVLSVLAGPFSAGVAGAQRGSASVSGIVRDTAGKPVDGVTVSVVGSGRHTLTDARGSYQIAGLIPGRAAVAARRLGFFADTTELRLREDFEERLDIRLQSAAEPLPSIAVTGRREAYDSRLAGFHARRKTHVGHFVTRERIDRANSTTLSDILREIPGVKIGPQRNEGRAIRLRGATCPPLVFIDGVPATAAEFDVDIVDLNSVEGIEVYAGGVSVPAEFMGPRDLDRCGVIVIWSRPSRARSPEQGGPSAAIPR